MPGAWRGSRTVAGIAPPPHTTLADASWGPVTLEAKEALLPERAPALDVRRGVLHVDGEPRFLWSADYPYYRDDAAHWRDRLMKLREAGVGCITSYIPWRHHGPRDPLQGPFQGAAYDFDGTTQPNRDVKGFLRLCHELGLEVMVKPGPFVHAELCFGGLPDYVDPERNPAIEAEMLGSGAIDRWIVSRERPQANHALPAPLDAAFVAYAEHWLAAVTREVIAPFTHPRGPIVAVQLLNEGIYSDSSNGIVPNHGYSRSTTAVYRAFLQRKYATLEVYNRLHGTRAATWEGIANPVKMLEAPVSRRQLLEFMDRSEFGRVLYEEVLAQYRGAMLRAGMEPGLPVFLNYNPNGEAYAKFPGSNDGWYSKIEFRPAGGVQWSTTSWMGGVPLSAKAHVQHILAASRERGPNLEEDWGFGAHGDLAPAHASPSYFQSLLHIAHGATGINVYTGVGTKAWRGDDNLRLEGIPWERITGQSDGEYPGHAPISADGERLHKYWTIAQLGAYLAAEGASMATSPRAASLAWVVHTPYAWAGAWAPRGSRDHRPFHRAGFRACPHVTYHGLESLIETSLSTGLDWRQVDLLEATPQELARCPLLILAAYDFMAAEAQEKLVGYVRGGGHLLLTGLLPRWNDVLEKERMPLREALFPHAEETFVKLTRAVTVDLAGGVHGRAVTWAVKVVPPAGAEPIATIHSDCVGYRTRLGSGTATYLGYHPWYATLSGDDVSLVEANRGIPAWAAQQVGLRTWWAKALRHEGVDVTQYDAPGDVQHLAIVSRASAASEVEVQATRANGEGIAFKVAVLPQSGHLVTLEQGQVRSLLLKNVNDHDGLRTPPRLVCQGKRWGAEQPCDLAVTPLPGGVLEVSVANVEGGIAEVALGIPANLVDRVTNQHGHIVASRPGEDGGVRFEARDMMHAGAYRVELRPGAAPWWRAPAAVAR